MTLLVSIYAYILILDSMQYSGFFSFVCINAMQSYIFRMRFWSYRTIAFVSIYTNFAYFNSRTISPVYYYYCFLFASCVCVSITFVLDVVRCRTVCVCAFIKVAQVMVLQRAQPIVIITSYINDDDDADKENAAMYAHRPYSSKRVNFVVRRIDVCFQSER